jgi:hypothetical protein
VDKRPEVIAGLGIERSIRHDGSCHIVEFYDERVYRGWDDPRC